MLYLYKQGKINLFTQINIANSSKWMPTYSSITDFIKLLSGIIVLITILVAFNYVGVKGQFFRAVSRLNKSELDKIALKHRKLIELINKLINKGGNNLDIMLRNKDIIVKHYIYCLYPNNPIILSQDVESIELN